MKRWQRRNAREKAAGYLTPITHCETETWRPLCRVTENEPLYGVPTPGWVRVKVVQVTNCIIDTNMKVHGKNDFPAFFH